MLLILDASAVEEKNWNEGVAVVLRHTTQCLYLGDPHNVSTQSCAPKLPFTS